MKYFYSFIIFFIFIDAILAQISTPIINPYKDLTVEEDRHLQYEKVFKKRWFELEGYFRIRNYLIYNFDLNREKTQSNEFYKSSPFKEESVTTSNMRLRLNPQITVGNEIKINAQIDFLDNIILGSTPRGFPSDKFTPQIMGSTSQEPPLSGKNSFKDSISVKKVWAEFLLPFGLFIAGRMPVNWGLGILSNSGERIDDDIDDSVDRIGFITTFFNHWIGFSYDFNASGPSSVSSQNPVSQPYDITDFDDVNTISFGFIKYYTPEIIRIKLRAKKTVFNYGFLFSYRTQKWETPTFYILGIDAEDKDYKKNEFVKRDVYFLLTSLWLRLNIQRLRIEFEGVFLNGKAGNVSMIPGIETPQIKFNQFGMAFQSEWQVIKDIPFSLLLEAGLASGDKAPGFGAYPPLSQSLPELGSFEGVQFKVPQDLEVNNFKFHPNYHIDEILWRRIVGTFTDGIYIKSGIKYYLLSGLMIRIDGIYSRAIYAETPPGLANPLGFEIDSSITYFTKIGFEGILKYAVLFPLDGFRNVFENIKPETAHFAGLIIAFRF